MRSKYKKRDNKEKIDITDRNPQIVKNNIINSSALDIKKNKDKQIDNVIFERTKPFYNRYEKINYVKGKITEKFKKEEILNENKNEKDKKIKNIISNKEIHEKYKKLIININKDEKKVIQDNKLNDVNSSKLMNVKQKSNFYNKYHRSSNDTNNIKNSQINKENNKKSEIIKNEIKNNNNNIKYIYKKEMKTKNIKDNPNISYSVNLKQKKNYESSPTESSLKFNYKNNNLQKNSNKENNNTNRNSSLIDIKSKNSNNELQAKESFKYLVHEASKSRDISNSFQKYYEKRQLRSRGESIDSNLKDETLNSEENSISKYKFRNLRLLNSFSIKNNESISCINSNTKENKNNCLTDRKLELSLDKNNLNTVKIINFKYNVNQKEKNINNEKTHDTIPEKEKITQNIINNNIYNTTLNFYKIDNVYKTKYFPKTKNLSAKNLMDSDDIIYENEPSLSKIYNKININNINNYVKEEYSNKNKSYENLISVSNSTGKQNIIHINLENIISLEKILKILLEKINKYQICEKECLEYILYFFNNKFYDEGVKVFKLKHTKNNFLDNVKIEILCFFLCYDILFSKTFNQTAILLKSMFNLIHSNLLIFISYIINNAQININKYNSKMIDRLKETIAQDLKIKLKSNEMNDYTILQLINNNSKNINNYYKMIIDNLYAQYYSNDDSNLRFPQCLINKNKISVSNLNEDQLLNIKSNFFFDAYRLLTNYNFDDLYDFFNFILKRKGNIANRQITEKNYNNNIINKIQEKSKIKVETKFEKYLLPKIGKNYKYSLVLDLDETLICIKRDSNNRIKFNQTNNSITLILRPGLLDFLHNMKKIYELILFSFGTSEYVSPIIKNIEKNEKYFEHILYREHVTYENNGSFFKNLNLLNREVKNVIIVDDNYKNFKYHKSNGICIKPFFGDSINDKNTLKILGNILYKIRYDADLTGDIRISLNKEKNSMFYSQIANN